MTHKILTFDFNAIKILNATPDDLNAILFLQKRAFIQEAEIDGNYSIVPLRQTYESIIKEYESYTYLKAVSSGFILGAVRGKVNNGTCFIGRLIVEPIFQGKGIGSLLLSAIENFFGDVTSFELFTGEKSPNNITFYSKRGYQIYDKFVDESGAPLLKFRKSARQIPDSQTEHL